MIYEELEGEDISKEELEELKDTIDIRFLPTEIMEEKYEVHTYPEDFHFYNITDEQYVKYKAFFQKYFPYYEGGSYIDLFECGTKVINLILNNNLITLKEKYTLLKKYDIYLDDVLDSHKMKLSSAVKEMFRVEKEIYELYSLDLDKLMFNRKYDAQASSILKLVDKCLLESEDFLYYQDQRNLYSLNVTQINAVKTSLFNALIELQFPNSTKQIKRPRENKFSLANTVFIFDLFRDVDLIPNSTSNKTIAESISLLTGFSEKQAINQFAENTDNEVNLKLKKETIELLESMIERLK